MTRKQIGLIIAANAVISIVISVIVALLVVRPLRTASTATPTVGTVATQPAVYATSTAEPIIHVVQAGDTISALSLQYDVPQEDIIAANQLVNPHSLNIGMELIIPLGGVPEVTATLTPIPTATETPLPPQPPSADMTATAAAEAGATPTPLLTPMPSAGEVQIQIREVIAPGEPDQEHIVIVNVGDALADMQGWTLSDAGGNTFTFPNVRLWGGGSVTVHTRIGQDGNPPNNFFWGKLEAVWSVGEVARLTDTNGQVIATHVVGQ